MPPRFSRALLVLILAVGCSRPSLTLADKVQGAWAVQTIDGEPVPEAFREEATVIFFPDGRCQRGEDVGAFEAINEATIRTRLGDRVEDIAVDIAGDKLTMRMAGVVTVLARATP